MNVRPLIVQIQASSKLQMKITMSDTNKEQHYPVHTPTLGIVFVVRLFDYNYDSFFANIPYGCQQVHFEYNLGLE